VLFACFSVCVSAYLCVYVCVCLRVCVSVCDQRSTDTCMYGTAQYIHFRMYNDNNNYGCFILTFDLSKDIKTNRLHHWLSILRGQRVLLGKVNI